MNTLKNILGIALVLYIVAICSAGCGGGGKTIASVPEFNNTTIQADSAEGNVPFTTRFTIKGDPDYIKNISYLWNFGDGSFSAEQKPTHVFSVPGNYNVQVSLREDNGSISSRSLQINVKCEFQLSGICANHASGVPGNEVSVPLDLINASGVSGATLFVDYETDKLIPLVPEYTNLIKADFVSNIAIPGQVRIALAGAGSYSGSGTLLMLKFKIKQGVNTGKTSIKISNLRLHDFNGDDLQSFSYDGAVFVQ